MGAVVTLLRPLVPKMPGNDLKNSREEFLLQGQYERIRWYGYGDAAFLEARRTGKPILLEIGAPWSGLGRDLDAKAFQDDSIIDLLARDFVCMRIDGMRHQDWMNAIHPFGRPANGFLTGCQLWVLDPTGREFDIFPPATPDDSGAADPGVKMLLRARQDFTLLGSASKDGIKLDPGSFLQLLKAARDRYVALNSNIKGQAMDESRGQLEQISALRATSRVAVPDIWTYHNALLKYAQSQLPGFPSQGIQSVFPAAWEFQLRAGDWDSLESSLDPLLISPLTDIVDGGFFRLIRLGDGQAVEFDKLTERNAEMLVLLARLGAIQRNHAYTSLAKRTWDYLTDDACFESIFATARTSDETLDGRSSHSSYSLSALRAALSPADRAWAGENLGLKVGSNHQMSAYPTTFDVLDKDEHRLNKVLAALRASDRPSAKIAGVGQLDTCAFTAARMVEAARLWRDPAALDVALDAVDSLAKFRDGGSLKPDLYDVTLLPLLPDYLSYADAQLQEYLATGRVTCFEQGLSTLQSAIEDFETDIPGSYRMAPLADSSRAVQDIDVPEIIDNTRESCTAQLIRLCLSYGWLSGDTATGRDLQHRAFEAISRFALVTEDNSPRSASYFCSAMMGTDYRFAIATGPHAQELSDALYARVPTRLVAPAVGPVRRDLQKRAPGIYILHGREAVGPLSLEEAVKRLPVTYTMDPLAVDTPAKSVP